MVSLDHLNMTVKNLNESIDWYRKVFGFELVERGKVSERKFAIIRSKDSMLCIYEHPDLTAPGDGRQHHHVKHFAFRITDRNEWEKRMVEEKISVHHTWQYPHSYSWYLVDPSGYEIEVALWNNDQVTFTRETPRKTIFTHTFI